MADAVFQLLNKLNQIGYNIFYIVIFKPLFYLLYVRHININIATPTFLSLSLSLSLCNNKINMYIY